MLQFPSKFVRRENAVQQQGYFDVADVSFLHGCNPFFPFDSDLFR